MKPETSTFEEYSGHALLSQPRSQETQKVFCLLPPLPWMPWTYSEERQRRCPLLPSLGRHLSGGHGWPGGREAQCLP